jgi:Zn-finger nucleic acid-binding protein
MPYNIKRNYGGCSGYAVVSDSGKIAGCHKTQSGARAQQKALYANVSDVKKSYPQDSAILKCCPDQEVVSKVYQGCGCENCKELNVDCPECPMCSETMSKKGPCWEGYEQIGWKTKDGRRVPNCVPKDKTTKAAGDRFEIVEEHPKCEGVALVEKDGTTVLCYLNREEAEKALADMRLEEPEASMRPDPDTAKSMDEDDEDGESHDKKKKKKKSEFWRGAFA